MFFPLVIITQIPLLTILWKLPKFLSWVFNRWTHRLSQNRSRNLQRKVQLLYRMVISLMHPLCNWTPFRVKLYRQRQLTQQEHLIWLRLLVSKPVALPLLKPRVVSIWIHLKKTHKRYLVSYIWMK